jgi:acetyl esterase/lipase
LKPGGEHDADHFSTVESPPPSDIHYAASERDYLRTRRACTETDKGGRRGRLPNAPRLGATRREPTTLQYGPHDDQRLLLWHGDPGTAARPLVFYIAGGGWMEENRGEEAARLLEEGTQRSAERFLGHNLSFAALFYRKTPQHPLPTPVLDVARAVQYLRAHAKTYSLDAHSFVAQGFSAGGCTALWLALHDDLARPRAADRAARESTRVLAALTAAAQTSIDPPDLLPHVGPLALEHPMIPSAVGQRNASELMSRYAEHSRTLKEFSPASHVDAGDPPTFLLYTRNAGPDATDSPASADDAIHHWKFGSLLREKAKAAGYGGARVVYTDPRAGQGTDSDRPDHTIGTILAILSGNMELANRRWSRIGGRVGIAASDWADVS